MTEQEFLQLLNIIELDINRVPVSNEVMSEKVDFLLNYNGEELYIFIQSLKDRKFTTPYGWFLALKYIYNNEFILFEKNFIESCDFCGKNKSEVSHLVQGINNNFICDACASLSLELMKNKVVLNKYLICDICGKKDSLVVGEDTNICEECIKRVAKHYNKEPSYLSTFVYFLSNFSLLGIFSGLKDYLFTLKIIILNLYDFPIHINSNKGRILSPIRYFFYSMLFAIFVSGFMAIMANEKNSIDLGYKISVIIFWFFRYAILLSFIYTSLIIMYGSIIRKKQFITLFTYYYFTFVSVLSLIAFTGDFLIITLILTIPYSFFVIYVLAKWLNIAFGIGVSSSYFLLYVSWMFYNYCLSVLSEYYHPIIEETSEWINKYLAFIYW